ERSHLGSRRIGHGGGTPQWYEGCDEGWQAGAHGTRSFGTMVPMYQIGGHDDSTQTASSSHRGRAGPDGGSPGETVAESAERPGRIPRPVARRPARGHSAARAREQATLQAGDTAEDRR